MKVSHLVLALVAAALGSFVGGFHRISDDGVAAQEANVASPKADETLRFRPIDATIPYDKRGANRIFRAKIPGGWLVMLSPARMDVHAEEMTFVPDPGHTWDGNSVP